MRNKYLASETTPLRREGVKCKGTIASVASYNKDINSIGASTAQAALTNPSCNNIKTCRKEHFNGNFSFKNKIICNQQPKTAMDTNKQVLCRVGLDVLILFCVGIPILLFFLLGEPFKRGFFCDDESLKHPFKDSTVRNWMLYLIGLAVPVGVIFIIEVLRAKEYSAKECRTYRRYDFMNYEIPVWLIECYKKIGVFGFGAAISQLTTDIAKYSIGRLRPHFIAVCQPIMPDGSNCNNLTNAGKYITEFKCQGVGSSARMLKEMRLSFPSGHSSFTFYTMVYVALYLQARMNWQRLKLLRHFLQFLFIMIAWYTALSRVSDYKHHWSDVLAGSAIGTTCALIVANYVSDLFLKSPSSKSYVTKSSQDISQTQSSVVVTTN